MKIESGYGEKLIIGNEYYTYEMRETNKGNAIKDYTGIIKVKVLTKEEKSYGCYVDFEIIQSKKLSSTMAYNIQGRMNNWGMTFFDDYDECVQAHDKEIVKFSRGQKKLDKEYILKKLIDKKNTPKVTEKKKPIKNKTQIRERIEEYKQQKNNPNAELLILELEWVLNN